MGGRVSKVGTPPEIGYAWTGYAVGDTPLAVSHRTFLFFLHESRHVLTTFLDPPMRFHNICVLPNLVLTNRKRDEFLPLDEFSFCHQMAHWFEDFRFRPRDWIKVDSTKVRHEIGSFRKMVPPEFYVFCGCVWNLNQERKVLGERKSGFNCGIQFLSILRPGPCRVRLQLIIGLDTYILTQQVIN